MPVNEFEKQVQKRLDDFQLNPSASVWKNVEQQIQKKKRRRVIFFFLLTVLCGLLSYSVYYFIQASQKTEQVQQAVNNNNNKSPETGKNNITETKEQPVTSPDEKTTTSNELTIATKPTQKTGNAVTGKTEFQVLPGKPASRYKNNKLVITNDDKTNIAKKKTDPLSKLSSAVQTKPEIVVTTDEPAKNVVAKNKNVKDPDNQAADQKNNEVIVPSKDSLSSKTDSPKTEDILKTENKTLVIKKNSSKRRIKWGIDFSGGISSNQGNVLSLSKSYDASSLSNSTPTGVTGSPPGGALTLPPSSIKPGLAFRVGAVAELTLSGRSKVSIGLQYAYASNRIKTGTADRALRLNTNLSAMVDQVYRGPQNNSYTNSYHFLSMPVAYHWQINKTNKLPLQWNIAVSPGYLLSTDALVYSSSNGGSYYYDKNVINRFHLSAGTGLSLRLKGKKGMEYIVGPEISFDTRKLIKSPYERKQYLVYWGIGTRLLFPQKKK